MSQSVGTAIMGFIQSDVGISQLKDQAPEVSKAMKMTIVSLSIVVISFTINRIVTDLLDIALMGATTYAAIKTKLSEIPKNIKKEEMSRTEQTIALLEASLAAA
jgi:hypothetical protein